MVVQTCGGAEHQQGELEERQRPEREVDAVTTKAHAVRKTHWWN